MSADVQSLVEELRARASALGFDAFGIAPASARPDLENKLHTALARGWHGDMEWMAETAERRARPQNLWADVRSVIMVGINYGPRSDPLARLADKKLANISAYAQMRDYHDVVKGKIKELAGLLARRAGAEVKVFVDTAPVMEKPLAEAAGLGWQGKHTVLVSREFGSWLFWVRSIPAPTCPRCPHAESCGTCTRASMSAHRCLPRAFQLDARKCLAYYSVEHKGQSRSQCASPWATGCSGATIAGDLPVEQVCKHRPRGKAAGPRRDRRSGPCRPACARRSGLSPRVSGTPVRRLGWARLMRNGLVAAGNSGDRPPAARAAISRSSRPADQGMAIWALKSSPPTRRVIAGQRRGRRKPTPR